MMTKASSVFTVWHYDMPTTSTKQDLCIHGYFFPLGLFFLILLKYSEWFIWWWQVNHCATAQFRPPTIVGDGVWWCSKHEWWWQVVMSWDNFSSWLLYSTGWNMTVTLLMAMVVQTVAVVVVVVVVTWERLQKRHPHAAGIQWRSWPTRCQRSWRPPPTTSATPFDPP